MPAFPYGPATARAGPTNTPSTTARAAWSKRRLCSKAIRGSGRRCRREQRISGLSAECFPALRVALRKPDAYIRPILQVNAVNEAHLAGALGHDDRGSACTLDRKSTR